MNDFSMKKYLMTGMAAVVFGGLFTSCSHDIESDGSAQETIQKTYEEAFITRFGQPAADLDWGFGSTQANTRVENANANEWADPEKAYGGLLVPPVITPTQAAVVKTYFQTHDKLGYKDPEWSNYFIQQVYKGHTSVPQGCATPEEYTALNGTTKLIASDYMDHLAAIDPDYVDPVTGAKGFFDHINNFNHGDCGENDHVLDNGGNANDGPFHKDKIMYMKNSTTKSFGYFNSNGSICHTEYTALVGWKTIHDWAVDNYPGYDGCLNDNWNRSYMGFDFEQMIDDQCYATVAWNDPTVKELTFYGDYYVNGVKQTNYVYQYNDKPVKMLSDQTNRYCGDLRTVTDEQLYSDYRVNGEYLGKQLNTDVIDGLLADGYLPIDNKSFREWAKVGGCADGYFSDWIVTLTEAKTDNNPNTRKDIQKIRVIAEDLTVDSDAEGKSDFDFNDVVFDVVWTRTYTNEVLTSEKVEIVLKAAGGTLPLYLDGKEVHQLYKEANKTLDIDQYTMINTHAESKGLKGKSGLADITFPTTNYTGNTIGEIANSISVYVEKGGKPCVLTAPKGDVASKVAVGIDYDWCNERQDIDEKYSLDDGTSLFKEYVKGALGSRWYYTFNKK